jgi:hypothetical protein
MKEKEPLQCWIVNIMSSTNPYRGYTNGVATLKPDDSKFEEAFISCKDGSIVNLV